MNAHKPKPTAVAATNIENERPVPDARDAVAAIVDDADTAADILAQSGIVFTDAADFVAQPLPPPSWIVKDFIALKMKGDLCGSSKTQKTYLAQQLGESIAAGRNFLGAYHVAEPHAVAYVNLELFDWNFQERLRAQMSACTDEAGGGLGIAAEELRGRFFVCNMRGCDASALRENVGAIIAYLKAKAVEFVIIDPRYKLLKPGEDENTGEGLRSVLDMRDQLAEHFAVMLVTHDPKGDTSQKKTTDRGAGSYTAGADFDFRLTIDRAEGWTDENRICVVCAEGRARKTPPPIGVRFDDVSQIFRADKDVAAIKQDNRLGAHTNAQTRAARESVLQENYTRAARDIVERAGDNLLDVGAFDNKVATISGASLGINRRGPMRKNLVSTNILATCPELERKPGGGYGNKKNGKTFISTPERIEAYRQHYETFGI